MSHAKFRYIGQLFKFWSEPGLGSNPQPPIQSEHCTNRATLVVLNIYVFMMINDTADTVSKDGGGMGQLYIAKGYQFSFPLSTDITDGIEVLDSDEDDDDDVQAIEPDMVETIVKQQTQAKDAIHLNGQDTGQDKAPPGGENHDKSSSNKSTSDTSTIIIDPATKSTEPDEAQTGSTEKTNSETITIDAERQDESKSDSSNKKSSESTAADTLDPGEGVKGSE